MKTASKNQFYFSSVKLSCCVQQCHTELFFALFKKKQIFRQYFFHLFQIIKLSNDIIRGHFEHLQAFAKLSINTQLFYTYLLEEENKLFFFLKYINNGIILRIANQNIRRLLYDS